MKTRILIAVIVLLSILSMAPDFYLPIASKPCPTIWVEHFYEWQFFNPALIGQRAAWIFFPPPETVTQVKVFDVEHGTELALGRVITSDHDANVYFSLYDCNAFLRPYQVKFSLWFETGCRSDVLFEWVPQYPGVDGCPLP